MILVDSLLDVECFLPPQRLLLGLGKQATTVDQSECVSSARNVAYVCRI